MGHEEFFKSVDSALANNSSDYLVILFFIFLIVTAFSYVYILAPWLTEFKFKRKMSSFISKRYRFADHESEAIAAVIRDRNIAPEYLFFISRALFEKHEADLTKALVETCPAGIQPDAALRSIKEKLFD